MKKDFSIYEFVGILVPAVILMVGGYLIYVLAYQKELADFDKLGEMIIFIIVAYGIGNIIQGSGHFLDRAIWRFYKGMPTKWLTTKNKYLFSCKVENDKIKNAVINKFGNNLKDYWKPAYTLLFQRGMTARIDIFDAHYSMFRGLSVTFLLLSMFSLYFCKLHYGFVLIGLFSFFLSILSLYMMISFATNYAQELFQTVYYYLEDTESKNEESVWTYKATEEELKLTKTVKKINNNSTIK